MNARSLFILCLLSVLHVSVLGAPAPKGGSKGDEEFKNWPLKRLLAEEQSGDNERKKAVMRFLEREVSPKDAAELELAERELDRTELHRRQRGLKWLKGCKHSSLGPVLLRHFRERRGSYPPKRVQDGNDKDLAWHEEVLGEHMLKLAELGVKEAITDIRPYAGKDSSDELARYALTALARLKDEGYFGKDRQERLQRRYVDKDDPATKVWLKETMVTDPDWNMRLLAGDAFSSTVADPEDPEDIEFAYKLIAANDPLSGGRGFDILARRLAKGHRDSRIFELASEIAVTGKRNRGNAIQALSMFDSPPEYRARALQTLRKLLTDPALEIRSGAQSAIAALAKEYPHYEGEAYCDGHPKPAYPGGPMLPPGKEKQ